MGGTFERGRLFERGRALIERRALNRIIVVHFNLGSNVTRLLKFTVLEKNDQNLVLPHNIIALSRKSVVKIQKTII